MSNPRKVTSPVSGKARWACNVCGLSHSTRGIASACCENVVHIHGHRTPAQITAQLEARYAEMQEIYNSPQMQFPCSTCRWSVGGWRCSQPLIKGFDSEDPPAVDWQLKQFWGRPNLSDNWPTVRLCGIEKALWEPVPPKLGLFGRFWAWFISPWRDDQ